MTYEIPIDFCPKCNNKRIRVIQGKTYEVEYSLTGKCLKKYDKFPDTTYTLLKCPKCGWQSKTWNEAGYEDKEEYEELEKLWIRRNNS